MPYFPLIRTAVKLLLIVALAVQPLGRYAGGGLCAAGQFGNACQGCCGSHASNSQPSCACSRRTTDTPVASESDDAPKEAGGVRLACCSGPHESESAATTDARETGAARDSKLGGMCQCEWRPVTPLDRSANPRLSSEQREVLAVRPLLNLAAVSLASKCGERGIRFPTYFFAAPHFSQVQFGVWRI